MILTKFQEDRTSLRIDTKLKYDRSKRELNKSDGQTNIDKY